MNLDRQALTPSGPPSEEGKLTHWASQPGIPQKERESRQKIAQTIRDAILAGKTTLNLSYKTNITSLYIPANFNLTDLNLSGCETLKQMTGPSLAALTSLDLTNCTQFADPSFLQGCTNLAILKLRSCKQITDLSFLRHYTQLTSLDLAFCHAITDLSYLQHCTELTSLDLCNCAQITDLSFLQHCTKLRFLDMGNCKRITDVSFLRHLPQLERLQLYSCSMRSLDLSHNPLLQEVISFSCPLLSSLTLGSHPHMVYLDLAECSSLLAPPQNIAELPSSSGVDLSNIPLSNEVLQHLETLVTQRHAQGLPAPEIQTFQGKTEVYFVRRKQGHTSR